MNSSEQYTRIPNYIWTRKKLRGKSPEELQEMICEIYEHIPPFYSFYDFSQNVQGYSREELDEAINRIRVRNLELKPILVKKFDDVISLSPTTSSFKIAVYHLAEAVCKSGRTTKEDEDDQGRTEALEESLLIDGDEMLFSSDGAKMGEAALYRHVVKDYSHGVESALLGGHDTTLSETQQGILFVGLTLTQYKDFILNWHQEFVKRYGEIPFNVLI